MMYFSYIKGCEVCLKLIMLNEENILIDQSVKRLLLRHFNLYCLLWKLLKAEVNRVFQIKIIIVLIMFIHLKIFWTRKSSSFIIVTSCQGCTNRCSLAAGLRGNEERMRKWRGNGEEMEREWGNEEEMERKWGNGERLTLYISSFSLYFLPLSPFPNSLSISSLSFHFLHQNASHFVAKC